MTLEDVEIFLKNKDFVADFGSKTIPFYVTLDYLFDDPYTEETQMLLTAHFKSHHSIKIEVCANLCDESEFTEVVEYAVRNAIENGAFQYEDYWKD